MIQAKKNDKLWDEWNKACAAIRRKPAKQISQEELKRIRNRVLIQVTLRQAQLNQYYQSDYVDTAMDPLKEKIETIFAEYMEVIQ